MHVQGLTFRRKLVLSQTILFLAFIALLFPFVAQVVNRLVRRSLEEGSSNLIQQLVREPTPQKMVERLQMQHQSLFFVLSLIDPHRELLYDSNVASHAGQAEKGSPMTYPDVQAAFAHGVGYSVEYSKAFQQKLAYVSISFRFEGETYVLRTGFPLSQIEDLVHNFEVGFLLFGTISLLFFSAITWFLFHSLSRPIQHIIDAITPYQEGEEERMPDIVLGQAVDETDEFYRLARTLNSLAARVREQLESVMAERNEKVAILDSLGEGVIAIDVAGQVRYTNPAAVKFLGLTKSPVPGKPFAEPPGSVATASAHLLRRCLLTKQLCQESLIDLEGRKLSLDLIAIPIEQDKGAILVVQDKSTERKIVEMGKDFVANASHELRTPITIIRGFAETLHDMPSLSPEMRKEVTEKIVRSCRRMEHLIKSLMTLADLEHLPESRFRNSDVGDLVEEALQHLRSVHPAIRVQFLREAEPAMISADPDILELAFTNLLENAVKYSTPPAQITVRVWQEDEWIKVSIADQGIGIPAEDLEHIFQRFYTVDKAHSRRLGGAGLGLSIVKTIIDKHYGKISVTSILGKGTTFTIELRAVRSQ